MTRRILPWSETCFVCGDANPVGLGVRFEVEGDEIVVRTTLDSGFEGYHGHVHGGVVTALLDETIGWACCLAADRLCYTVELNVRFKRPLPAGAAVTVRAAVRNSDRRMLRGEGSVRDRAGQVLATASGRYVPLSAEQHDEVVSMLKMPGRSARPEDVLG